MSTPAPSDCNVKGSMSETTIQKPKRGMRFIHARILNPDKSPAECTVTSVRQGAVWYKVGDESKAHEWADILRWPKICKEVLP